MAVTLRDFIKVSEKSGEASALIAENISDVTEYSKLLENLGYFCAVDSFEAKKYFSEGAKIYGVVTEKNCDFYYTLAKDYDSGDIHLFDAEKQEKIWVSPNRETSAFILIIKLSDLGAFKSKGFDFNVVCESAYRK